MDLGRERLVPHRSERLLPRRRPVDVDLVDVHRDVRVNQHRLALADNGRMSDRELGRSQIDRLADFQLDGAREGRHRGGSSTGVTAESWPGGIRILEIDCLGGCGEVMSVHKHGLLITRNVHI